MIKRAKRIGSPAATHDYSRSPALFSWGRNDIPGELTAYLNHQQLLAQEERGVSVVGARMPLFPMEGVERVARQLHATLLQNGARPGSPKGLTSKLRAETADWVYLLHAFCALHRRPAPVTLLWLTFDALGLTEGRPSPQIARTIGAIEGVHKIEEFMMAARIEGESASRGEQVNVKALERATGVPRTTIMGWRKMESYQRLTRQLTPSPAISESWKRTFPK